MVYATEETPLGTAGSVLNARDELDERFLVISGDVLTDINLAAIAWFHEGGALATIGLTPVENPLEFGIVITRDDGSIERFLEEAHLGPGVQRHHQHRHLRAGARDLRLHRAGPVRRLQLRGVPPPAGGRPPALRGRGGGLLGGRRHAGGLRPPTRTYSTAGSRSRSPASRSATACTSGRGRTSTPTPASRARSSSATTAGSRATPGWASTRCWAPTCGSGPGPTMSGHPRQHLHRRGRAPARHHGGHSATCATGCGARRAWCWATSASSASRRCSAPGVKVYPFKTVEGGAVINSSIVWESRGSAQPVRPGGRGGAGQRGRDPRDGDPGAMAFATTLKKDATVITSRDSSRSAAHAQAGDDGGDQRRGRQRPRPGGGLGGRARPRCRPEADAGITIRLEEHDPSRW